MLSGLGLALQVSLTAVACYGIWRLWKAVDSADRAAGVIAAIGAGLRGLLGVVLFALLRVDHPAIARLRDTRDSWFFSIDVIGYLWPARALAAEGPSAILTADGAALVAPVFTRLLAFGVLLFGHASSVALLINVAAYLGMAWCLSRWPGASPQSFWSRAAVAGVTFSPTWILWATQPLKDPFFVFCVVLFFWTVARLTAGSQTAVRVILTALVSVVALWACAELRWYYALLLAGGAGAVVAQAVFRRPRLKYAGAIALLLSLYAVAFFVGGGAYLPAPLQQAKQSGKWKRVGDLVGDAAATMTTYRVGFERTAASTLIQPGPRMVSLMKVLLRPDPAEEVRRAESARRAADRQAALYEMRIRSLLARRRIPIVPDGERPSSDPITSTKASATATRSSPETAAGVIPKSSDRSAVATLPEKREVAGTPSDTAPPSVSMNAGRPPDRSSRSVELNLSNPRRFPRVVTERQIRDAVEKRRQSILDRPDRPLHEVAAASATRLAMMFVPRFLLQPLGVAEVAGGRGFWGLADLDTIYFGVFGLLALIAVIRNRHQLHWPQFILVGLPLLAITIALAYVIANFGTLMRLREMVFIGMILVPLTAAAGAPQGRSSPGEGGGPAERRVAGVAPVRTETEEPPDRDLP